MQNKFGIMQGRLTKNRDNILQKFPMNWKKEFEYLKKTKLDYIEFFTEEKLNKNNPIWSNKGIEDIKKKLFETKYKGFILCDNFSVKNSISLKKTEKYFRNLIDRSSNFKNSKLIIPILSQKNLTNKIFNKYISSINKIINYAVKKKVEVSFEFHFNFELVKKFCKELSKNKKFFITYDTGNAFLFNKNFYDEIIILKKYVTHIHLKDRDSLGNNVVLGEGDIRFNLFLKNLNKLKKYYGTITFETNRGINPIKTANSNIKFIKNFL